VGKAWVKRRKRDTFYREAKAQGYRSRAAFKLIQIDARFDLIYVSDIVVDLGAAPGGWINAMGKFNVVKKGDDIVLRKLATNPAVPVARANAFIGLPDWTDYTIQADVSAQQVRGGRPDFGILNCRYHLLMDGKTDENGKYRLRITSWDARPRIDESVVFNWKQDTWYTLKLTVSQEGKVAVIRGKAWERGQPEPEKWTIEFSDPSPNREGAPALYCYVSNILGDQPGAEAYFDNLIITPNKNGGAATGNARK